MSVQETATTEVTDVRVDGALLALSICAASTFICESADVLNERINAAILAHGDEGLMVTSLVVTPFVEFGLTTFLVVMTLGLLEDEAAS